MAHSVEIPYLDKENIEIYLNDLATEIEKAKIGKHSILIVGGAAMALKYEDERSTVDIDICFREQNKLYSCCEVIAKNYNLPEDWINADVMHSDSFSYKLFDNAILYKTIGDYLDIYIINNIDSIIRDDNTTIEDKEKLKQVIEILKDIIKSTN
mgnify:CR=1 FL=1